MTTAAAQLHHSLGRFSPSARLVLQHGQFITTTLDIQASNAIPCAVSKLAIVSRSRPAALRGLLSALAPYTSQSARQLSTTARKDTPIATQPFACQPGISSIGQSWPYAKIPTTTCTFHSRKHRALGFHVVRQTNTSASRSTWQGIATARSHTKPSSQHEQKTMHHNQLDTSNKVSAKAWSGSHPSTYPSMIMAC